MYEHTPKAEVKELILEEVLDFTRLGDRRPGAADRVDLAMAGRFRPGDDLQVQRPWPYFDHGMYIDDRVIEFGSGVHP